MYRTLISTAELQALLGNPALAVVDCRHELSRPEWGREEYRRSHIPGARFLHLDEDLSAPKTGSNGRHPLPDPQAFARTLERAGIGNDTQVVVYDSQGAMIAGRPWWMLRHWLGHEAVAVLDGGWDRWVAEGRPVTAEIPKVEPARFTIGKTNNVVDAAFVLQHLEKDGVTLIDARAPDRFRGENETLDPVGGRIPGARNRFFRDNLAKDGRFKPPQALREEFAPVLRGVPPGQVVHQCGSGVSACHNILAMEIAGLAAPRLYAGSWSEWCSDRQRPVTRGP